MNKKVSIIVIILVSILLIAIPISYAISISGQSKFFEVNKTKISTNETLEMTLDISKVEYEKFSFKLTSNINVENITTDENVDVEQDDKGILINIDKNSFNIDKIKFYYQIPENLEINKEFELKAQILIEDQNEENPEKNETKIVDENNIEVLIIEKSKDKDKSSENKENTDLEGQFGNQNIEKNFNDGSKQEIYNNMNEMQQFEGQKNQTSSKTFSNIQLESSQNMNRENQNVETAIYNGSNNNYLTNLEIEGVSLNTVFNKENENYFISTEEATNIKINAIAEDANAKICITGADNLKKGENKILVSVTAENGNVRYYRIFVDNK